MSDGLSLWDVLIRSWMPVMALAHLPYLDLHGQISGDIMVDCATDSKKKRSRKFRSRGKKPKLVDWISLNSSGRPQLQTALDFYTANACRKRGERRVAGISSQEHHAAGIAYNCPLLCCIA